MIPISQFESCLLSATYRCRYYVRYIHPVYTQCIWWEIKYVNKRNFFGNILYTTYMPVIICIVTVSVNMYHYFGWAGYSGTDHAALTAFKCQPHGLGLDSLGILGRFHYTLQWDTTSTERYDTGSEF